MIIFSNNPRFKALNRHAIRRCGLQNYSYDGCAIMWLPEPLQNDMFERISQPMLDDFMRTFLTDPNGVLCISISKAVDSEHVNGIDLSVCTDTIDGVTKIEDRSKRNVLELILSQYVLENGKYQSFGPSCIIESQGHPWLRGFEVRDGHEKGVHIVKNGVESSYCVAMDACKRPFYPSIIFSFFLESYMGKDLSKSSDREIKEAEKLFSNLKLHPIDDVTKVVYFDRFGSYDLSYTDANGYSMTVKQIGIKVKYCADIYPLNFFQIIPDQQVIVNRLPDFSPNRHRESLQAAALAINRFKPAERKELIDGQIKNLELVNPVTRAFGVHVVETMLEGPLDRHDPVQMFAKNGKRLFPTDVGSFKINCQEYYKHGIAVSRLVVFSTEADYYKAMSCVERLAKLAAANERFTFHIEGRYFNTSSRNIYDWIDALAEFRDTQTLVIVVDGTSESHEFLKFAEAYTGVITQHLKSETAQAVPTRFITSQNIVHKLNVKTGGLNYVVKFSKNV